METTHPSIVKTLEQRAFDDPNRPSFVFVNKNRERLVLTRQQVWDYSRNVAALLKKSGLEKGVVIYNALPNSPQRLMGMFGTITAGCITMAAQSCMADGSDLISSLNRGQATGIILSPSDPKGAFSILKPRLQKYDQASGEVSCQEVPTLKHIFSWTLGNWNNFLEMLEDCGKEMLWHEAIDPNHVCAYMSTSGSSGVVKLVPFNSKVLMAAADQLIDTLKPKRYFCDLDLAWISGFPHVYLTQGSTRVLLDRGGNIPEDSAELQWKTAVQEKCDLCFTAPKYLMEFSRVCSQSKDGVSKSYKLKRIISAGGTTTRKHARLALGKITDDLMIVYGSTEGCITTMNIIKSIEEYEDFNTGFPVRNTEVKVVGLDNKVGILGTITTGCISFSTKFYMADGSDLKASLNRAKATAIVLDPSNQNETFSVLKPKLQNCNQVSADVLCEDVPSLKYILPCDLKNFKRFAEDLDKYGKDMMYEALDSDSICVYCTTSGSSGVVKLSPFDSNVLFEFADTAFARTKDKVYMCDNDFGWLSGFPLIHQEFKSTRVLLNRGSNIPKNTTELQWNMAVQEKCELCFTDPRYLIEFSDVKKKSDDPDVRTDEMECIISGGGPITRNHVQTTLGEVAKEVVIVYGSTEGGVVAFNKICSIDEYEDFNSGYLTRNSKVKVVGIDRERVPTGHLGEILFQSSQSLLYYVNDPENTSKTFDPSGWISLGDVGKINEKGQLYVMGRNKFAITRGNNLFYPEVIESFVQKCPGVKDVAVVGVPDEILFEDICALVIKHPTADISEKEVRAFCERMTLNNSSMVPNYILFVDSFPRTQREKLDRNKIKELACETLKLQMRKKCN